MWMILAAPYTLLVIAFGWGVWKSAGNNRRLRTAGGLLLAYSFLGLLWPFAPMHLRENLAAGGATWSDTMHIALGAVTEILYLLALCFAATALGKSFRLYSIITFIVLLLFGTLTFLEAPGVAANEPTPLIGVWERINIGVFLLWVVVLAVVLMRREKNTALPPAIDTAQ
jgi:phosphotransferase system  glucose/maltose/N-acetylglucosamine-specific IIC component